MAVVVLRGGFVFAILLTVVGLAGCASGPADAPLARARVVRDDPRADGKVIRADWAEGEIYINLTKKDHVREGMKFECYDARKGVKKTGTDVVQPAPGTATLEIVEVGQEYSCCRVVRTTMSEVHEGDPVAGYNFFKGYVFHLVITGDFDLDGDGVATVIEREQIEMIAKKWGAVVDAEVRGSTDYLIVGKRPASPAQTDPMPVRLPNDVADHRTKEQKAYDKQIERARELSIPVCNQNRALVLMDAEARVIASR